MTLAGTNWNVNVHDKIDTSTEWCVMKSTMIPNWRSKKLDTKMKWNKWSEM